MPAGYLACHCYHPFLPCTAQLTQQPCGSCGSCVWPPGRPAAAPQTGRPTESTASGPGTGRSRPPPGAPGAPGHRVHIRIYCWTGLHCHAGPASAESHTMWGLAVLRVTPCGQSMPYTPDYCQAFLRDAYVHAMLDVAPQTRGHSPVAATPMLQCSDIDTCKQEANEGTPFTWCPFCSRWLSAYLM